MKELYNEWVMLHDFFYKEPIKNWINEETFTNNYIDDWEYLMEFVEKIEGMIQHDLSATYNVLIEQCFVEIIVNHTSETIVKVDAEDKKKAIYKAVLEFVKWWNIHHKKTAK